MSKSGYKYQIEQELLNRDWEVIEIGSNEDWWDDEHWKVRLKYEPTLMFFLCFIVDPQFDQPRKKGQGVYKIIASTTFPNNWNDHENHIGSICMAKRKFDIKLNEFLESLNNFKRKTTTIPKPRLH